MYYFDNAATTAQKPDVVSKAVYAALTAGDIGNPSRGAHGYALKAYDIVLTAKERIQALFHSRDRYEVAFTHNSTVALNMVLKGLIRPGDGVLTTAWEHNAVLRPLYQLEEQGVEVSVIPAVSPTGALAYESLEKLLTPKTKWLVCNHASNVTGNVLDLDRIKAFCRNHHLGLIVDVSQTAGACDIDLSDGIVTAAALQGINHSMDRAEPGHRHPPRRRGPAFYYRWDGVHTFERSSRQRFRLSLKRDGQCRRHCRPERGCRTHPENGDFGRPGPSAGLGRRLSSCRSEHSRYPPLWSFFRPSGRRLQPEYRRRRVGPGQRYPMAGLWDGDAAGLSLCAPHARSPGDGRSGDGPLFFFSIYDNG